MSGKPYTVSELKTIVDYLVENKLYSETRARKMWVDFANTKLINRTWQSLKETFIKRILPDIHNPYFKLTNEQISSFRARCDLAEKEKNKLEIQTISDDSSSHGNNSKDMEPSNDEVETTAGENTKCSKISLRNRSSADTVILEHCYETVEDIRRDLESTEDNIGDLKESVINKSLRDCITYSEPLTPILQEVLDDFASEPEDSDRENRMEIIENDSVPEAENVEDIEIMHEQLPDFDNDNATTKSAEADTIENYNGVETIEELLEQEINSETRPLKTNSNTAAESELDVPEDVLDEEISSMQVEIHTEKNIDDNSELIESVAVEKEIVQPDASKAEDTSSKNLHPEPQVQSGPINTSNSTVDASLPNNPEAFKNKQSKNVEENNKKTEETTNKVSNDSEKTQTAAKAARKRSVSEEPCNYTHKKKKRLHIQLKSSSESEGKQTKESHKVSKEDKLPKVNGDAIKSQTVKMGRPKNTEDSKPSTSAASNDIMEIQDSTTELPAIMRNPCLQTVSLFDEQFNKTRQNSSDSSDSEKSKKEAVNEKPDEPVAQISKETSKSRSESESEITPPPPKKKKRIGVISTKSERDKAIANMFGVTSVGGGHSKRKRRCSHHAHRARTTSHNNTSQQNATRTDSSDWTSDSESEAYVSPPRSRKNRSTKKYLKPRSLKISSLEEEGGLFLMYGKRIYPVVKDGKILKNYVTYLPESDSEEELYWKQKYVEEKKKAAELKKLLEEATEPKPEVIENNPAPAVQQPNPISTPRPSLVQVAEPPNCQATDVPPPPQIEEKTEAPQKGPEKIKIKFTKNNEEVHLEGHWGQIHPVLEQVVQIFHKESETAVNEPPQKPATNGVKELNSGLSTPIVVTVDPEVHEKVNKIEKEIFQEIEELDQEEDVKQNGVNNVTKRKQPAPRKSSSSSTLVTPEKRSKISNGSDKQKNATAVNGRPRRQKTKETENKSIDNQEISPKRQTKTPRKVLNETVNTSNLKTMQTRRSKQILETSPKEQEEVKYMLTTRSRRLSLKTANNKTNKKTYKSPEKIPRIFSSPDNLAPYSMDSTQGYHDTDTSPAKPETRRKKKLDMSSFVIKTRNSLRRNSKSKSYPYLYCDAYNDSSNSSVDAQAKVARENSTLKSEAYRSDSYQHLMPQVKIVVSRHLEPIHEAPPNENVTYFSKSSKVIRTEDVSAPRSDNITNNSGQLTSDVGSSSNMSLPMSPELSIVENLSVSKELLNSAEDYPTINEMQITDANQPITCNNYRISEVDVTVPLMNQECDFESYNSANEPSSGEQGLITESLLKKIDTFNINDQVSATDTLNKQIHDLLLESAKKASRKQENKDSVMEVDVTSAPSGDVQKKAKAKKRCSTPQKRKISKKSAAPQVDPVVEEEHVESFSQGGGRQSCPPLFQAYLGDEILTEEIDIANLSIANEKPKGRKKKDIIRVKIQRPKHKTGHEKVRPKSAKNASRLSIFTDSGINETESEVFQPVNESVELIHNHSETCLLANECVGDSLEFVDNSKSVITLDDSLESGDAWNSQTRNTNKHGTSPSPDVFCNNAQDVCLNKNAKSDIDSVSETVYHSPYGTPNSLITEDISDDSPLASRPAKWYLLSEDETNNTNLVGQGSAMLNAGSYASNLKHIFPVTCAVPDLSTITEMSDNSRKPALEDLAGLTGDDFNSLSVFDSNFNV